MVKKPAKSPTDDGNDGANLEPQNVEPQEPQEPAGVTPPTDKGPSKQPEDWEQKYNTLLGQHRKLQTDYKSLNEEHSSIISMSQKLDEFGEILKTHGDGLNLLTDIVSTSAEYNEELQGRIKQTREQQQQATKRAAEAKETWTKMGEIAQIGELNPPDKEMQPAMQAFQTGNYSGALKLTTIAVKTAVASKTKPAEILEPAKSADKDKLKQPNLSPKASQDWRDLPRKAKILEGLREARE